MSVLLFDFGFVLSLSCPYPDVLHNSRCWLCIEEMLLVLTKLEGLDA